MTDGIVVERAVDLIQTDIDDELVALDIEQGTCFGFNATATAVWRLLDQPRSLDAIVDHLTGQFAIGRAECMAAVTDLIADLTARKLVRTRAA